VTASGDGVTGPARRLSASLLALGRIRLELLALEVEEEKERLVSLVFWAVLSALLAGFGALLLVLLITVALWDTHRLAALGVSTVLFLGAAAWGMGQVKRRSAGGPSLFRASIGELRRDAAAIDEPPAP
jgi:uncharacterized membrane protein YqjE